MDSVAIGSSHKGLDPEIAAAHRSWFCLEDMGFHPETDGTIRLST